MSNQQAVNMAPSTGNYIDLTNQFSNLARKCEGRRMTEDEESKLFKVADTYGALFGVSRQEAIEQLEISL